jgi:hypothetical protein
VSDSYSYGAGAKRRRRPATIDRRTLVMGLGAAAIVLAGGFVVTSVLRDGGEAAVESTREAIAQVDVARDAEAQVTLSRVAVAAQTVVAQTGTGTPDAATPEALADVEPAFMYTADASTGPEVVSVAATPAGWSAAVLSPSGSCLWIKLDAAGVQTFGSGTPCTGSAAAAASAASW